ncbi:MAG: prevent-host-death family protein [Actinomycetota bacterium]
MVRHIGIRDLRQQATTYIHQAGAGERLIVTISGQPVALLSPLENSTPESPSMADLIAHGAVVAPRRTGVFTLSEPITVHIGARIDQLLRQVRG